jgi:membrane protein
VKIFRNAWALIKQTFTEWSNDKAPRLGAALSYYTIFALAPLLLVVIAVAGLVFGREAAQGQLLAQISGIVGTDAGQAIQTMIAKAGARSGGVLATVVGIVTLGLGATGVVIELQDALNTVWKVIPKPGRGIKGLVRDRLLSVAVVIGFGFLLIVSLVASAGLAAVGKVVHGWVPGWVVVGYLLNYGLSIGVIGVMLAMMFKFLPDVEIAWRDVWIGAAATSVLFHLGKYLIGLYVGRASVASSFGAAGSLAILLVWIYYTSQLILLGAEFTRVFANRFGSHVVPSDNAMAAPETPLARLAAEKAAKEKGPGRPGAGMPGPRATQPG